MKKRILSMVVAVILMMPLMPIKAFAAASVCKIQETGAEYDTLQDAISAVENSQTIIVLQDLTCNELISINNGKTFTIDFNDGSSQHTFTWNGSSGETINQDVFTIGSNSNVTVKNLDFLVASESVQGNRLFKVDATGTLTLYQMKSNDEYGKRNIPVINYGGTVIIDGGNITTDETTIFSPQALNRLSESSAQIPRAFSLCVFFKSPQIFKKI